MKIMQFSRTGLILGILYIVIILTCVIWAQFITDPKGKYIILQLPVVLQHGLLLTFNSTHLLHNMPWVVVYLVLAVPMLALLIFLGNVIENLAKQRIMGQSSDEP